MPPVIKQIKTKADNSMKIFYATLIYYSNPYSHFGQVFARLFLFDYQAFPPNW